MMEQRKRRSPIRERLAADMAKRIRNNEFPAYSMMPSIRELAARYEASPRTVEAALRRMCETDLLQRIPNRGFRVQPPAEGNARIAILYQEHGTRSHRPDIAAAAGRRLAEYGYMWDSFDLRIGLPAIGMLRERYAGVLFAQQVHDRAYMECVIASGIPQVTAGWETELDQPASYVDRDALIRSTVRMLYDMGHREIALMVLDRERYFYPLIVRGFLAVRAELGLADDEGALAVMRQPGELGAYLRCRELLKQKRRPTAIIASRDYQACGIQQACEAENLTVGRDISLVGYDDIGWPGGRGFLTTYAEPCEELGRVAADILHSLLSGDGGPVRREVKPVLKLRRTLCPIPAEK